MPISFSKEIPVMEEFVREEFEKNYLKPQKPVIIRNFFKGADCYNKWTLDYFKQVAGDVEVGMYDDNKKENLDKTLKEPNVRMKFRDYLDLIASEPTKLRIHLFDIFKHAPQLREDFYFPQISSTYLKKFPYMFFGGKGSVARMHQDIDLSNVFLTQFTGKRRVTLFEPDYSSLLYRYPFNVHSAIDVSKPDYENFPALNYVKGLRCELEHGDTLFMPGEYWHYIEYTEGGFGMSIRSLNPSYKKRLEGVWKITVLSNIDDMMRKMLDKKWFEIKTEWANKRAETAMRQFPSKQEEVYA